MNRLVHLYERRLRRLPADHPYSGDYEAALAAEREKSERVAQELVTAKDQIGRLQREVAKVTHHRTGLTEDRDSLTAEVESVKGQYNDLVSYVRAEKKRLRERREEYGHYLRSRGLAKLARLVDTRLTRIRAHVEDTSAVQPKLLEYNQALGNVRLLRALEENGEIVIKSPSVMSPRRGTRLPPPSSRLRLGPSTSLISWMVILTCVLCSMSRLSLPLVFRPRTRVSKREVVTRATIRRWISLLL
ncbi:unnamed protein product [Arabidopsis halleri]